ncbi:hypothetical protein KJ780_03465 [Candidatus Micrarchaeota archaeon]|nr:hypothetical protein [Candidatus Micrarchaeota archaeon]
MKDMKRTEIKSMDEAINHVDYLYWFKDEMIEKYISSFGKRQKLAPKSRKDAIVREAGSCVLNYALFVYYLYPNDPVFKKKIKNNPELLKNFKEVKKWLDTNKGKKFADEFIKNLQIRCSNTSNK